MTNTETYSARVAAAAAQLQQARDDYTSWFDAEWKRVYAEMRAADKAAGRDTSGKSVSGRRCAAHDKVMMSAEAYERRAAREAAEDAYRAAKAF